MDAFEQQDRANNFKDIDLCVDELPTHQSLGLNWELETDTFTYKVSPEEKPFSRRGLLSIVNGIFDPMGFVAPIVVTGKLLLREIANGSYNWDDPLPRHLFAKWSDWKQSLISLEGLHIPRCYSPTSSCNAAERELHIFSDASEQAIASVAYLRTKDMDNNYHVGFVLGKAKVAPTHGHTIPRLELCAAVLAVQVSEIILDELDIQVNQTRFYTDSQVVLGYIHNQGKRFYKYVENRVERIRKSTQPIQWSHVRTNFNPADSATRTVCAETFHNSMWILGPPQLRDFEIGDLDGKYPLLDPDNDSEIRQNANVKTLKSGIENRAKVFNFSHRTERFSKWNSLVQSINRLKMLARKFHQNDKSDLNTVSTTLMSEQMIILNVQKEAFFSEIECIKNRKPFPRNSSIGNLNPFIDQSGLLRVGGRLKRAEIELSERHPIILPKNHHVSILLIRHLHESVKHQGRHFTAGAIRTAGYWIVGEKTSNRIYHLQVF
ncbi:Hypothetical predicted protein [Mytilus galloprovincialis]|uniref:Uncharacterized protein n=1 Tax=Mytilus galloprovincialis TaxID=29158 RepID=A0A8B6CI89_MYTGA|nr:Hypothetical predicted protein [Mytilus galloprovincialis]